MTSELEMRDGECKKRGALLLVIIAAAVGLRIAVAIVHPFMFPDSKDYDALARTMVEHRTYEAGGYYASRMPGYPAFIAAIYFVCGYSMRAVLVVQAFLGGASVYLVWRLGRRCGAGVGLVAAAVLALDPLSIAFSAALLTEALLTLLLLAAVCLVVELLERPRLYLWLLIAATWTVAVYVHPAVYWCIVPMGLLLMWWGRGVRDKLTHGAGLVVTLLLVQVCLVPWQHRSEAMISRYEIPTHHDNPTEVHFTTIEGISLYEAVYPEATGGPRQDVIRLPTDMKLLNEAQRNDEWSRRAWAEIRGNPWRVARLAVIKMGRTWSPVLNAAEFQNAGVQMALAMWNVPLFLLAGFGFFRGGIALRIRIMLLVPVLYITAVHAMFLGSVRYRVPLTPVVAMFAAGGIIALMRRGKFRKQHSAATV